VKRAFGVTLPISDENPHKQSWRTKVWGAIVWMASGYHPTTFSCQNSLPRLPVPQLTTTVDKFVRSMEPLYGTTSDEFRTLSADAVVPCFSLFCQTQYSNLTAMNWGSAYPFG
jgi:hypothetical protein